MKRRSNAAKSIFTVVLILLLLAVAAVIAKLSNGFTSDVKTFYVKVNGKQLRIRASSDWTKIPRLKW